MPPSPPDSAPDEADRQAAAARLKHAVRGGARAMIVAQLVGQFAQLAILACLYRLLTPGDYGLFWLAVPLVLFLRNFNTLGLNIATVQRGELSAGQLTSAFWLTLLFGCGTAVATAALAPVLVWFYGPRELGPLTVALAPTALVAAIGAQHQALLERKLRFNVLSLSRVVAQAVGGMAAVFVALAGWGIWALVVQWYAELGALAGLVWLFEPWRPARPGHGAPIAELLRFGGFYTASGVLFYFGQNLDKVLLGYVLGHSAIGSAGAEAQLGYYSQAFNLMMKPVSIITTPLLALVLPGLSRAVGNAPVYRDLLFAFTRLIGVVLLPAGIGLVIVAPDVMHVLGGEQWLDAGRLLRILAIAVLAQGFFNSAGSMLASVGRADRLFYGAAVTTLLLGLAFSFGLWAGNRAGDPAAGLAASYSLALVVVIFAPYMVYTLRTVGVSALAWFGQLRTAAVASISMGIVVIAWQRLLVSHGTMPPVVALASEVAIGILTYGWFARRELSWFRGQLRRLVATSAS